MIALVAGFLLVAYLLAPGAIYRLTFSFYISSKRFQRTRTEEVVFSVLVTLIPFLLTWILLLHTPLGGYPSIHGPIGKREAYSAILSSLLSDTDRGSPALLSAYLRVTAEQARFIASSGFLCAIEGWLTGRVIRSYGDYPTAPFFGPSATASCSKMSPSGRSSSRPSLCVRTIPEPWSRSTPSPPSMCSTAVAL